jgi:hypothetical protein
MILLQLTDNELALLKKALGTHEKRQRQQVRNAEKHERTHRLASLERQMIEVHELRERLDWIDCYDDCKE